MSTGNIIGAVEIGTGKTVAVVGEILRNASLNIIGIGEAISEGIKKGEVIDMKNATRAVHAALLAAEESAKASLQSVYLAQTGGHLEGFLNEAELSTVERKVVDKPNLEKMRDVFIFSCYTGLSYADVMNLKRNNIIIGIDGGRWISTFMQKKIFQ